MISEMSDLSDEPPDDEEDDEELVDYEPDGIEKLFFFLIILFFQIKLLIFNVIKHERELK